MSEFLRCDATGCDHREAVESITSDMVGKPCPKCGANLLTQSDYDVYAAVLQPMMKALHDAGLSRPATGDDMAAGIGLVSVNYHDGELRVRMHNLEAAEAERT